MSKQYDVAVYIGRFQPFHKGHEFVINEAQKIADKVVILKGSSESSRRVKSPFSFKDCRSMILDAFPDSTNLVVLGLPDFTYEENQWMAEVQELVYPYTELGAAKVCIIGHVKDDSSYYLKNFPQWSPILLDHWESIDATHIRKLYFEGKFKFIESVVPKSTMKFLLDFSKSNLYNILQDEYNYLEAYKKSWDVAPWPPIFFTVDAVVIQSGHILLVERLGQPGKGLYALPGGFIESNENSITSCIRELREETKLKVAAKILKGSVTKNKLFDKPDRSERGRTITNVYLFELENSMQLPEVRGSNETRKSVWIPLNDFYNMEERIFEDHYHIVRSMIDNR